MLSIQMHEFKRWSWRKSGRKKTIGCIIRLKIQDTLWIYWTLTMKKRFEQKIRSWLVPLSKVSNTFIMWSIFYIASIAIPHSQSCFYHKIIRKQKNTDLLHWLLRPCSLCLYTKLYVHLLKSFTVFFLLFANFKHVLYQQ